MSSLNDDYSYCFNSRLKYFEMTRPPEGLMSGRGECRRVDSLSKIISEKVDKKLSLNSEPLVHSSPGGMSSRRGRGMDFRGASIMNKREEE